MVATAVAPPVERRDLFGPVPVTTAWPGETFVCLGSGPSLTKADVDACRGKARVIAVKDAVRLAPWADVLYGAGLDGSSWWARIGPTLQFNGLRYTLDPSARRWASVLGLGRIDGLSTDPSMLAMGHHSGYQAINLAVLLGAARVVLLGYDQQTTGGKDHFFGAHWHGRRPPFDLFLSTFGGIVEPLRAAGVTVINASRETALTAFPRRPLAEALC